MTLTSPVRIRDSISIQLLKLVFSFYFTVTIIITLIHMVAEFWDTREAVKNEISVIGNTAAPGLAQALWDMNPKQLQTTFLGMVQFPAIEGIKLENEKGEEVGAAGLVTTSEGYTVRIEPDGSKIAVEGYTGLFHYSFPVFFERRGKPIKVGQATIYSSTNVVLEKVQFGFLFIIVNSVIKTAVLWGLFVWIFFMKLSRPLAILTSATEQLKLENLHNTIIDIQTTHRNELKILEEGFNRMIQKLKEESEKIQTMVKTFEKFVPQQFLNRIAKGGMDSIKLGNVESDNITILFSDIRSFTTLSEAITPEELFVFLNDYFRHMGDPIDKFDGFIDKFMGDAIMALFGDAGDTETNHAYQGVHAAIAMHEAVAMYNEYKQQEGQAPITIGIGVHSGKAIIGTVGTEKRMDSTVLGDSVNLASRLEGLTKYYGSGIIISHDTLSLLDDLDQFDYRELDWIRVKGKTEPMSIYEIFNFEPKKVKRQKKKAGRLIRQGLYLRQKRAWEEALQSFHKALEVFPDDPAAKFHIQQSMEFQKNPPDDNWDGASTFQVK